LGGMVTGFNRVKIKSGANAGRFMGRFVLEDLEGGGLPVTLFDNQLQQFERLLVDEAVVLVRGQVRERGSEVEITVEEIVPVNKLAARPLAGVDLKLTPQLSTSQMLKLRDLLTEHPGEVPVTLEMQLADRTVRIATPDNLKIQLAPALVSSIEGLLGQGSIRER
jgi:DNA polymerase-3 subunit alpha